MTTKHPYQTVSFNSNIAATYWNLLPQYARLQNCHLSWRMFAPYLVKRNVSQFVHISS